MKIRNPNLWMHKLNISPEDKHHSSNYKIEDEQNQSINKAIHTRNTRNHNFTATPTSINDEIEKVKDLLRCPTIFWNSQLYSHKLNLTLIKQIRIKSVSDEFKI